MTSLIDRLEERGFVRRQPHPTDRRGVLLTLTDAGRDIISSALNTRVKRLHTLADTLTDEELNQVSTALRKLLLVVDRPGDRREESAT
jgi:DNA-binding MarR family transcriptional regulator